jgi:hypothetical protein
MRMRAVAVLVALAGVAAGAQTLLARPNESATCCSSPFECESHEVCCAPEAVGLPACDLEKPGYCRTECVPGFRD